MKKELEDQYKKDLLMEITRHVGRFQAVSMARLYEQVFGQPWKSKITDTRNVRRIITALRKDGVPICSRPSKNGGGYYLASASSDLEDYCMRLRRAALRKLGMEAKIRRTSLPELLGQLTMSLEGGAS